MVNHFLPKSLKFCVFVPYGFAQTSLAWGQNTFNVSISTGNIKCSINCCKCWHYFKFKVSSYITWYVCRPQTNDIWTKSHDPECTKFWAFGQKRDFFNHFWQQVDTGWHRVAFARDFCSWNNCLTVNYLFSDYNFFTVPKIMIIQHV